MSGRTRLMAMGGVLVALALAGCTPKIPPPGGAGYVALGDSYTAGPIIPLQLASAQIPAGCLQSDHNYPHVNATKIAVTQFDDASCSGATTDDMANAQSVTGGTNAPQFNRLTSQTQVVTLGIGGNDIGFADIALSCISATPEGTPCQDKYIVGGDDTIHDSIVALGPKLTTVLLGIHSHAPAAKLFVVGYPAILPDTGDGCYPVMPITAADVPYLRSKEQELNAAIQTAAAADGDTYVDTYTPSIGHDACQASGVKWVEPVVPTSPAAPVHPNSLGEAGMAVAVLSAMTAAGVQPKLVVAR